MLKEALNQHWYPKTQNSVPAFSLLWLSYPFAFGYALIMRLRRMLYQLRFLPQQKFSVPICVVGNLTLGGTGKTPLVIHLAQFLQEKGFRPGIVSRGYKGKRKQDLVWVTQESSVFEVGDEPLLMAKRLTCPLIVARNRSAAVQALIDSGKVDIVISDDGLQHYAMGRDIEIAVVDGARRLGNGFCLPFGPLREPASRLKTVDFIVANTPKTFDQDREFEMVLKPHFLYQRWGDNPQKLDSFQGKTVHAIAGIGHPDQFFQLLVSHGLKVIPHAFPDHYVFKSADLDFEDSYPILMTEKDAVKCTEWLSERHWILRVDVVMNPLFDARILTLIQECKHG